MNSKNLKKITDRTPAERHELAVKAGKASGKKRRELKSARELLQVLLAAPLDGISDMWSMGQLQSMKIEEASMTQKICVMLSLLEAAKRGNVRAIELVLKLTGEYPTDATEPTEPTAQNGQPEALEGGQDIRISFVDSEMNEVDHEIIHCPAIPAAEVQAFKKKHK